MSVVNGLRARWLLVLGGVVSVAVASAGFAFAGSSHSLRSAFESRGAPMNYGGPLATQGAGLSWPEATSRVLGAAGMGSVVDATLGDAPRSMRSDQPWMTLHVRANPTEALQGPGEVHVTWIASLAQGAIAELHRTEQASIGDVLSGSQISVDVDDHSVQLDVGQGYVALGQTFSATQFSDDAITEHVTDALAKFGLQASEIRILRPLGAAVFVRVEVADDVHPSWTVDQLCDAINGTPRAYEGVYLQVEAPDGSPLLARAVAYRTGLGGTWFAPGQNERFGAVTGLTMPKPEAS